MKAWIKLFTNGAVIVPLLLYYTNATLWGAIAASLGYSAISYVLGDLGVLRWASNLTASISDAVIAYVYFWAVAYYAHWSFSYGEILFAVIMTASVEAVFHLLLLQNWRNRNRARQRP